MKHDEKTLQALDTWMHMDAIEKFNKKCSKNVTFSKEVFNGDKVRQGLIRSSRYVNFNSVQCDLYSAFNNGYYPKAA